MHSNGYSLVRHILKKKKINLKKNNFLSKELIRPTNIYVREILNLIDKKLIHGCANITGGGIKENISRVIPENLCADIYLERIKPPKIFKWLKQNKIKDQEMLKTFNCGMGFCLIANPRNLNKIQKYFKNNFKPYIVGRVIKGSKKIKLNGKISW